MKPENDPTSFGNLARIFLGITDEDIEAAMAYQRENGGLRLGFVLLQMERIEAQDVDWILAKQKELRSQPRSKDVMHVMDWIERKLALHYA